MLRLFINTPEDYPITSQYLTTLLTGMAPIESFPVGRLAIDQIESLILKLCEAENPDKFSTIKPRLEINYLH